MVIYISGKVHREITYTCTCNIILIGGIVVIIKYPLGIWVNNIFSEVSIES